MAVITIDGKKLEVPDNKNVLECALDAGIYIPHLCHHKDLNPLGSCRMCIVEVNGQDGVMASCTLEAKDGMVITTKSQKLDQLRRLALELLLAGHPEDCSTCPKYGNCELQMLIQYIGPKTGRLKMRTKGFSENEKNPLIIHDMNRCVLCGRCVRACNELRGVKVLHYQKKEMETYVGTLHDRLLKDSDCRFCQVVRHALKYVQQVQYAISLLIQMKQKRMLLCHAVMHALPIRIFRGTYDMSEVEIMMLPQQ